MKIFDPTIAALGNSLNLRVQEQNVIASNIANEDTPGYKAKALDFESAMRNAMDLESNIKLEAQPGDIGSPGPGDVKAEVFDDPNGVESLDGNTVDRGQQMAKMKENQISYNATVEALRKKLSNLEYAITEGGGNK